MDEGGGGEGLEEGRMDEGGEGRMDAGRGGGFGREEGAGMKEGRKGLEEGRKGLEEGRKGLEEGCEQRRRGKERRVWKKGRGMKGEGQGTFLEEMVFCISTGCWVMLEKGTSMENLMLWSSWTTRLDTILKLGFFFPPTISITMEKLTSKIFTFKKGNS